jgi:N-acyl-D-aspartate/D-glutamate deacylase
VAPGFLETHTHYDPSLFWNADCDPMPQHGVTSVLFGNCGLSLAPVHPSDVAGLTDVFCYIEDMPTRAFDVAIPWSWQTYGEYLDVLDAGEYGVNVAGMVGHSVMRIHVMGEEAWERASTPGEIGAIARLLDDALVAGAFGMSTSLGFDTDRNKRPVPSQVGDDAEFRALAEVLAARQRILQFIPNSIPKYLMRDVRRVAEVTRGLDVTQTWINVNDDDRMPDYAPSLLDEAADLQRAGTKTFPQVSPRGFDIEPNWDGGMAFYTLAKSWHRMVQSDREEKRRLLQDPEWRAIGREEWDSMPFTMVQHKRPERMVLNDVVDPRLQSWVGRSFADLCAERGGHPSDVLADWLLENDLRPSIVATGVANGDPDGVAKLLCHPAAVISNSDAGAHVQMMCADGDSTLLLTRHVRDRGDMPLEEAIRKITKRPAEVFGFHDRGAVAPGLAGDLVVFDLDELSWERPVAVHDLPEGARRMRRPAGGYRATVVNGVITQHDGELTGRRPGTVLRSSVPL